MATLIQDPRQPHAWTTPNLNGSGFPAATAAPNPNQRFQYAPQTSRTSAIAGPVNGGGGAYDSLPPLPPHNDVEMTREKLMQVLDFFSSLLPKYFDWSIVQGSTGAPAQGMRFVVHGGACMLLHPGLYQLSLQQQSASPTMAGRTKTRDVDYIHRGFLAEYGQRIPDAADRLKMCIQETARAFNLGADWMNSDADIALPMAHDPTGKLYDPIYTASITPQNMALHTIYKTSNGFLTLVSVTPFWAVALKLVRYTKWDPGDICLLLRNGTLLSKTQWTPETLEGWLLTECWAMGYINFDARKKAEMRSRIEHAIQTLAEWNHYVGSGSSPPGRGRNGSGGDLAGPSRHSGERDRDRDRGRTRDRDRDLEPPLSALDVMGGGASVVGGEFPSQHGWKYSFGTPQGQTQGVAFAAMPPNAGVPPGIPPGQLHVSQWGVTDQRAKSKSRSKSKSRNASRVASRNNSPEQPQEIFIPPDMDSEDEGGYGGYYDHGQGNSRQPTGPQRAYEQPSQNSWMHPNHGAVANIPPSHSHPANLNAANQATASGPAAAWRPQAPTGAGTGTGGSRVDPYAMRNLDQAIGAVQYGPIYSSPQEYGNHLPGYNARASGSGFQPVIPVIPPDTQAQLRRKKDKQRHIARQQARGAKWQHSSETESEESDDDSDDDQHYAMNKMRDPRERNHREQLDPLGKKMAQSGPWHNIYAPAVGGRSNSGPQSQASAIQQQQQQQHMHSQDPTRQFMPYGSSQDQSSSMLTAGRKSRPSSRNPSPNPDTKRRPPPLNLTPPPVIPGLPPQMQGPNAPVIPPPSRADPALLAQYQFEQQKLDYQREREQNRLIAEREQAFYQQKQFKQVPAQRQQPPDQRQQQYMYQQQQYQQQQQQQLQQYQYQYQQQMHPRAYR